MSQVIYTVPAKIITLYLLAKESKKEGKRILKRGKGNVHFFGVCTNLFNVDDFTSLLDVGEHVFGGEDGLTHALLVYLSVCLASLGVWYVEYKPTWRGRGVSE